MMAWLSDELDQKFESKRYHFADGSRAEVDGVSSDGKILCEAWAHQGEPKSAQKFKVMNDAMKMVAIQNIHSGVERKVLLFADENAARVFRSGSWRAVALAAAGVEVMVCKIDDAQRQLIVEAQGRQYR